MPTTFPRTLAALRGCRRALLRRSRAHEAPPRPTREEQLEALLEVLDDAVAAQPLADQVVAACGAYGPVPGSLAQDGGWQLITFNHLAFRLGELSLDGELAQVRERASRLLAYDLWMIHESLRLAFASQRDNERVEAARLRVNGLGAPADALRRLRDDVRHQGGSATLARSPERQESRAADPE
ncbi:hypothetical protein GCM10010193_27960 [Kitasatospora atroaurantiaca]|uniref:Uncharacterized protein n=1 Tax=Kitasatospora atroaurantiaca TaxID=285545 RepID=A0A561EJS3_9ACTN|nr:YjbH domain-containing protein [Kitasatospora atroaurantiaca]TWE15865.1 hypothetical protein FB465_0813 [Kitasatospora atroaurantiaca]